MPLHAPPRLVLLAAGASRRFGRPKQLEPVGPGGATLPAYAIVDALAAGFARVVVVTSPELAAPLGAGLRQLVGVDAPLEIAVQRSERARPWGTAHAVLAATEALDGRPFGVANGDDWYGPEAFRALHRFLSGAGPGEACLVGYPAEATLSEHGGVSRGRVLADDGGRVISVEECHDVHRDAEGRLTGRNATGDAVEFAPDDPVSMNLWGFPASALDLLAARFERFRESPAGRAPDAEFLLSDEVGALARAGAVSLTLVPGGRRWFGLTHAGDVEHVRARLAELHAAGCYRWNTFLEPGDRPCS